MYKYTVHFHNEHVTPRLCCSIVYIFIDLKSITQLSIVPRINKYSVRCITDLSETSTCFSTERITEHPHWISDIDNTHTNITFQRIHKVAALSLHIADDYNVWTWLRKQRTIYLWCEWHRNRVITHFHTKIILWLIGCKTFFAYFSCSFLRVNHIHHLFSASLYVFHLCNSIRWTIRLAVFCVCKSI